MLRYEGPLGRLFGHLTTSALRGVGQVALGTTEGLLGRPSGTNALSRLSGHAVGATARLTGTTAYRLGVPLAAASVKPTLDIGSAVARGGVRTAKTARNLLTSGGHKKEWTNLWTGREWRTGAILAGEASLVGIPVYSGMKAVSESNSFGSIYGSPQGAAPQALSYDGTLNATGDLTLALSRNRHG